MRSVWCALWLVAAAALAACEQPTKATPAKVVDEPRSIVGISPADFRCEVLATAETMTQLLGAPARLVETSSTTPGVAAPCSFLVAAAEQEVWAFDIDCRDGMKVNADALFAQYERTSAEAVAMAAAAAAEPGATQAPAADGGRPRRRPELAREVDVGSRGLDHHGQGLLFIDDDAPCYVRITGPDAERRLALARHLVSALTLRTAPMTPRAAPR